MRLVAGIPTCVSTGGVPAGTVAFSAASSCPSGWIEANGQSTGSYSVLAAAVGATVPDLRGVFLRGLDDGRGIDPSRGAKTLQQGSVWRSHIGNAVDDEDNMLTVLDPGGVPESFNGWAASINWSGGYGAPGVAGTVRPTNVALLPCISTGQ